MVKLDDVLRNEKDLQAVIEIEIPCEGGSLTFGVRDKNKLLWTEFADVQTAYYQFAQSDGTNPTEKATPKIQRAYKEGDIARLMAFVKYVKDEEGEKPMSYKIALALPKEVKDALDEYIPTQTEIMYGLSKETKKKSTS